MVLGGGIGGLATAVHLRIASPPTRDPCYFGIDTPSKEELIASSQSPEEISKFIDSDSLGYVSIEGLHAAVKDPGRTFCDGCFTGKYLLDPPVDRGTKKMNPVGV